MPWTIEYMDEFGACWESLSEAQQDDTDSVVGLLEARGPQLGFPVWCKKSAVYTQLKLCLLGSQLTDPKSPLLGCVSYYRDSFARSRMSVRVSALRRNPNACN